MSYNDPNLSIDYNIVPSGLTLLGIAPDASLQTCFVRTMSSTLITSSIFTDGTAILSGGTLSNLNFPTLSTDVATMEYVTSLPITTVNQISLPDRSVQFNNGNVSNPGFAGSVSLTVSTSGSFNVNNRVSIIGTDPTLLPIVIYNGLINNIVDPINVSDVANKNYVQSITTSDLSNNNTSTTLLPAQIYNNILRRTINVTGFVNIQDILPSTADIITYIGLGSTASTGSTTGHYTTFSFIYNYIGPYNNSVSLFAGINNNIITNGNYLNLNTSLNVITVPVNSVVSFTSILSPTGYTSSTSPTYSTNFYINNLQTLYSDNNEQITSNGLRLQNFYSIPGKYKTYSSFIILPLSVTTVNSDSPHTYTFSELKGLLVTRNMTVDVTDLITIPATILASSEFTTVLGSGSIKFTIQNISANTLTLDLSSSSWSGSGQTPVIGPNKNGFFLIKFNKNSGTCTLYTIGIYNRSSV